MASRGRLCRTSGTANKAQRERARRMSCITARIYIGRCTTCDSGHLAPSVFLVGRRRFVDAWRFKARSCVGSPRHVRSSPSSAWTRFLRSLRPFHRRLSCSVACDGRLVLLHLLLRRRRAAPVLASPGRFRCRLGTPWPSSRVLGLDCTSRVHLQRFVCVLERPTACTMPCATHVRRRCVQPNVTNPPVSPRDLDPLRVTFQQTESKPKPPETFGGIGRRRRGAPRAARGVGWRSFRKEA